MSTGVPQLAGDLYMENSKPLHELSQAVRSLRHELGLSQQEFANRLTIAVRTVARWENNQPPRGRVLVDLAQLADGKGLTRISRQFLNALQRELGGVNTQTESELKGWLDGLQLAFRYRFKQPKTWQAIARNVLEMVRYAADSAQELRDNRHQQLEQLEYQLRERFREEYEDT